MSEKYMETRLSSNVAGGSPALESYMATRLKTSFLQKPSLKNLSMLLVFLNSCLPTMLAKSPETLSIFFIWTKHSSPLLQNNVGFGRSTSGNGKIFRAPSVTGTDQHCFSGKEGRCVKA